LRVKASEFGGQRLESGDSGDEAFTGGGQVGGQRGGRGRSTLASSGRVDGASIGMGVPFVGRWIGRLACARGHLAFLALFATTRTKGGQ
jgi:hypothetical protein